MASLIVSVRMTNNTAIIATAIQIKKVGMLDLSLYAVTVEFSWSCKACASNWAQLDRMLVSCQLVGDFII